MRLHIIFSLLHLIKVLPCANRCLAVLDVTRPTIPVRLDILYRWLPFVFHRSKTIPERGSVIT